MRFPRHPFTPSHEGSRAHRRTLSTLTLGAFLLLGAEAQAGTLYLSRLSAAEENPPTASTATGLGVLVLNDAENQSTVTATHTLGATATAGHIHRAAVGVNGAVIFPFPSPASPVGPLTWNMSTSAVDSLKAGELYMNFHTAVNPGGAIRGQLRRALLAPAAVNPAQTRLANALDISAGYDADLDAVLIQTNLADTATQSQALREFGTSTIYSAGRQQIDAMTGAETGLFAYAQDARLRPPANTDRLNTFVRLGSEFGRRSATDNQAGATISRPFVFAGVDRWLSSGAHGGFAIGYSDGRDSFENGLGHTNAKTTSLHAFASAALGGLALDAVAGYGWTALDQTRNLGSLGRAASASPDGSVWAVALKASRTVALANHNTLVPYALLDVQKATVDAYSETGAGAAGLVVSQRDTWSSAFEGGAALVVPIKTDAGHWTFRAQAGWRYLLEDGAARFGTRLAGSPIAFSTEIDGPGRSSAHVETGIDGQLSDSVRLSFGYRGDLGASAQTVHAIEARLAMQW
ncbi:MAG: autotransporter domain-containing protein [Opitutae bacterium]|nr:autotransporter domain-containing protein [Opitutae bacterium]